jgi:hypothetical protein
MWGNTVEGQRTNFAYNDANNPTHKQWSVKYNHFHDFNIKSDVFSTNGANDNNWSCLFGAGLQGNNDEDVTATGFEVEVALDHTTLAPGFTDQAGDDYTPGTNLNRGSGTHPLKYDIEGNLRNGDLYSGAVTISAAVVASGGVGTLNVDKMTALKDITGQSAGTVNDLEMYFLRTTLSLSGTNNDGWYAHMGTLGYSGAINDRWGQWFVASGVSDYDEFWYEAAQGNINLNP